MSGDKLRMKFKLNETGNESIQEILKSQIKEITDPPSQNHVQWINKIKQIKLKPFAVSFTCVLIIVWYALCSMNKT